MDRRTLFSAVFGGLATGVTAEASGLPPRSVANGLPFDPTAAGRDANGKAVCRIYRVAADGQWREIQPGDVRAGDRIVCVGQDGGRLWMCQSIDVLDTVPPENGNAGGVRQDPDGKYENLLVAKGG